MELPQNPSLKLQVLTFQELNHEYVPYLHHNGMDLNQLQYHSVPELRDFLSHQ